MKNKNKKNENNIYLNKNSEIVKNTPIYIYTQYYKFIREIIDNKKHCDQFFAFFSHSDSPFISTVSSCSYLSRVSFFLEYRAMMYLNLTWKEIAGSKHEGITVRWPGTETAHFIIAFHTRRWEKRTRLSITDPRLSFFPLYLHWESDRW